MPCVSDYLEPNHRERALQKAAKLYVGVLKHLKKPVPPAVQNASEDIYCKADYVPELCATLKALSPKAREALVYDAKSRFSRELATWWEEHQKADKERAQAQARETRRQNLAKQALAKLTPAEKRALGLS